GARHLTLQRQGRAAAAEGEVREAVKDRVERVEPADDGVEADLGRVDAAGLGAGVERARIVVVARRGARHDGRHEGGRGARGGGGRGPGGRAAAGRGGGG